jgi:tetratricopeptide (TPR) repeat protein
VAEFLAGLRLPHPRPWPGAAVACGACALALWPELTRGDLRLGFRMDPGSYPEAACDFIQSRGIRGRALNSFEFGGYLLWRFWPDPLRLPFMDIHQAGTARERLLYVYGQSRPEGWEALNAAYRPDFLLFRTVHALGDRFLEFADSDTSYALVFADDAAALYVRRAGGLGAVAAREGYRLIPGGTSRLRQLDAALRDEGGRGRMRSELDRMVASSPRHSRALSLRATLDLVEGRYDEARTELLRAHTIDPSLPRYHFRLGDIALARGQFGPAALLYEKELAASPAVDAALAAANLWRRLGRNDRASRAYRAALRIDSHLAGVRDSLATLEGR